MADRYRSFSDLSAALEEGSDYEIRLRKGGSGTAVIAPHGGGIEGGTTELADAIAGAEHAFYSFVATRSRGNAELHITSHRFDEPRGVALVAAADRVLALHGLEGDEDRAVAYVGGLDAELGARVRSALERIGVTVPDDAPRHLRGEDARNICNRNRTGRGVQIEMSRALRASLFAGLGRRARRTTTERFDEVVAALHGALAG